MTEQNLGKHFLTSQCSALDMYFKSKAKMSKNLFLYFKCRCILHIHVLSSQDIYPLNDLHLISSILYTNHFIYINTQRIL